MIIAAPQIHPRRSCLFLPASNLRAMAKAKTLAADTIIFDLEDAVAPEAKEMARAHACDAVKSGDYGQRALVIRINSLGTPWFMPDLEAVCTAKAAAILVPKILSATDIIEISEMMARLDADPATKIWAMIEMPLAILNLGEIAAQASHQRLTCLVMGFNDLAKEMHAVQNRVILAPIRAQAVIAARAYGLSIIDGVYNDFNDPDGLESECQMARNYGFDGKSLIHPGQIETANRIFAPSLAEIAEAQAIIAAFADPTNEGKAVIVVDGKMTELLHLQQAEQTIQLATGVGLIND